MQYPLQKLEYSWMLIKCLTSPRPTSYHSLKMLTQKHHAFSRLVTCDVDEHNLVRLGNGFLPVRYALIGFFQIQSLKRPEDIDEQDLEQLFHMIDADQCPCWTKCSPAVVAVVVVGSLLWIVKMGLSLKPPLRPPKQKQNELSVLRIWLCPVASYIPINNGSPFGLVYT